MFSDMSCGADVRAGVRLGEDHGGAPLPVDGDLSDLLLRLVALVEEDAREGGTGRVHPDRRVRAQDQLGVRPDQRRGSRRTADFLGQAQAPVLGVHEGLVALLEGLRDRSGVRLGVEDRRVAVGVREGLRELVLREARQLLQDGLRGVRVHLRERAGAVQLVAPEHLEEVELDVAEIRLVVPHGDGSVEGFGEALTPRTFNSCTNK
jgi:hypothetical protein